MATITERFSEALEFARERHAGQVRKGTQIPYLSHLLGVSALVLDFGGDEDQAIAGLLHDVVEDCGAQQAGAIRERFGERVARIVMACTDGTQEDKAAQNTREAKIADWRRRKLAYLEHMRETEDDALLVSGCDKLHNARAIVADLEDPSVGVAVFDRFTAGRDGTLWYYSSIVQVLTERGAPVARQLGAVVARMRELAKGS